MVMAAVPFLVRAFTPPGLSSKKLGSTDLKTFVMAVSSSKELLECGGSLRTSLDSVLLPLVTALLRLLGEPGTGRLFQASGLWKPVKDSSIDRRPMAVPKVGGGPKK